MTTEEKELRDWLALNKEHFIEGQYSMEEVAFFAHANNFDHGLVYRVLSHFEDALHGRNIEDRAAVHLRQTESGLAELSRQYRKAKERLARKLAEIENRPND